MLEPPSAVLMATCIDKVTTVDTVTRETGPATAVPMALLPAELPSSQWASPLVLGLIIMERGLRRVGHRPGHYRPQQLVR